MRISDFNKIVQGNDMDLARNNLYSIEIYMPRGHGGEFGTSILEVICQALKKNYLIWRKQ